MHLYLAEALGTLLLILFGNGVVANVLLAKSKGQGGGLIAITAGWGFAVAIGAYAVGRVSGAHLNPAVTLALACFGGFSWSLVPGYILAQLAGAFLGSALVDLTYAAHWAPTADPLAKLSCHCTTPAIRNFKAAFTTEVIGTAVLVLGVELLGRVGVGAQPGQEAWAGALGTWFGPALVGLLVFAIGLSLGGPTGYAINPARDLGPRLAHALLPIPGKGSSDWSYAWIPVVAPLAGGLIGAGLFKLLRL
jgi:glycerol uptake facilitator protein